jgi:hypothetical protein
MQLLNKKLVNFFTRIFSLGPGYVGIYVNVPREEKSKSEGYFVLHNLL